MKILVGVDGSAHSRRAIDYLSTNRQMFVEGQELYVIHVCTGLPTYVVRHVTRESVDSYYAEEIAKVIEPTEAYLAEKGIANYTLVQRHGHAAEEIVKAARELGAGLIVMGTHGHGILGRMLMGSVATRVLAETDISMLLVQ